MMSSSSQRGRTDILHDSSDEEDTLRLSVSESRAHPGSDPTHSTQSPGRPVRQRKEKAKWEVDDAEGDYEDEDYVYPNPMEEELEDDHMTEQEEGQKGGRLRKKGDDDLWRPGGAAKVSKSSVSGGSREKRNTIKRSFEHTLSPAASKILKMEEQRSTPTNQDRQFPSSLHSAGGGSLNDKKDQSSGVKSRAAAAADAVNAVVAAARPKPKLLTAKQRLGKIMGLKGGGSRWKV